MTPPQLHILQHSLGVDSYGRGQQHRNRFVTDTDCPDGRECLALCALGLMSDCGPQRIAGGMNCFVVTDAGRAAMEKESPTPPKLSAAQQRYRDFLNFDGSMGFIEFLRWRKGLKR